MFNRRVTPEVPDRCIPSTKSCMADDSQSCPSQSGHVSALALAGADGSPPVGGQSVDRLARRALEEGKQRRPGGADVPRRVAGWLVRASGDPLVLGVHLVPRMPARGGGPAVELMERTFPEQDDQLGAPECARPAVEVVVHQPAARQAEALVQPPELVPDRTGAEQAAALARGAEQPPAPRTREGADLEQPVSVRLPA